jgi:hypothetical protein
MDTQEEMQSEIPAARMPFDAEFIKKSEEFCVDVLRSIPELHGIALVPVWENKPEKMPAGLLQLRNTQPPYYISLITLLAQLDNFSGEVHKDLVGQLKFFQHYAVELNNKIQAHTEELNKIAAPQTDEQT